MKSLIKIKAWIVMFATVVLSLTTMGASTGSHIGKPGSISVGSTKTVTLVNEYDGEEYYDSGAYYLKVKLNKYSEYTVTASGCASLTVETDWEDENSPLASFDDYEIGDKFYSVLTSDGWDEDDPNVGEFYIYVDGEIGDKVVVSVSSGNNLPVGIAENPNVIKLQSTQSTTTKLSLSNYEYYFEAQLKEGRKYTFQTVGGTTNNVLQLSSSADFDYYEITEELVGDEEGNMKVTIYPNEDGEFTIIVNGDEETGTFQLSHKVELEKTIAAHDVIELNKENGFATEIKPGYVNNPESGFYDNIIDEALCKVALKKGASYIFETEGAATNLLLAVYDAKGERKALIQGPVAGSYDLIYAMTAEEDGSYYFGVAQDIDELGIKAGVPESPVYAPVTVRIREIDLADDNVHPLSALPASGVGMKPEEVDVEGTGPFVLDESHWSQTFAVGARKGLSYHIKAVAGADTAFTLTADVFTRKSNGGENSVSTKEPIDIGDGITIEAEENATYYVRVTVAEGKGYCYPEFTMHCSATSSDGEALGILTVFTKGADGTWSLNSEKTAYESGVSILVAGKNTVKFSKEQDRSKPADEVVEMEAGKTTVITGVYNDTYDPQDDTAAGAFKMNISAKATVIDRTLYADDEFDNLSFVAKDGVYYNFAFTDVSGDCVFSITNAEFGVVCEGVTSAMKIALSASKSPYYVVVHHENETPEDGRYIMEATSANVGAIKFAKTTVSAKENAAYADVVVNRTAKEGAVRVRFGTVAGTAQPGREYYPTNGVIYWADGDNKAKTIRVRLIPDVIPTYEGAAKLFSVKLEAFEEDELEDDNEYVAKILTETVAVSLTEVSKKAPGTISVISYNDGSDDYELANPKNPEVFVCAGEDLTLNWVAD